MTNLNITATTTITKAAATELVATGGYKVTSTTKGVVGQFDKVIELIKALPQTGTVIIGAAKLKGIFKALGENSKDAWTFKQFIHSQGWELRNVGPDYTIFRQDKEGIVLTQGDWYKQTAEEVVDQELSMAEEKEMVDYSHEYVPTRWEQVVADKLGVEPSKLPEPVYPVVPYTGPVVLPTVIQLGVVYSTLNVDTDQGTKICKFLYTPTGVVTCKGNHFESVEALINAVQAAFKLETQEVSETTQEVVMKTFVDLMKEAWIPSRETWVAQTLINKMRTTWTSGKYPTDENQKLFMKAFVAQVEILPQGVEMPARAFLTAYDMVVEQLTGAKPEISEFKSSMTGEEAASSFEGEHTVEIVTQTITKKFEPVALPKHLKKSQVKELPKPETRSYKEILLEKASKSVQELTKDSWDMQDFFNLESICESFDGEEQYQFHVNMIRMWIQENTQEGKGTLVHTQEKPCEDTEEMSEGKVTIKNMLGKRYTIEVFFNSDKTLWINTKSGESFNTLSDLCMVHDKEYFSHEFFVENKLVEDKENKHYFPRSDYKIGDILCAIYEEHFNPVHHDDEEEYITGILVVKNGFEYDGKFYKTLQELCNELSEGKCKDVVDVLVNL